MLKKATDIPITMLSWLIETMRPLTGAGAISAMYMGAMSNAAPTPKPPIMRATTSARNDGASAEATAETTNRSAAPISTNLRPKRSLKGPANIIASVAVRVSEATDQPSSILVKSNSASINFTTPEMTEASKPMRKPPRATIMAILAVNHMLALMLAGRLSRV